MNDMTLTMLLQFASVGFKNKLANKSFVKNSRNKTQRHAHAQHNLSQTGLSVVELLVSMGLGLLVAGAGMFLFSASLNQSRNTKNVVEGADVAQMALNQVAGDIRSVNFLGCGRNLGNNVAVPGLSQSLGNDFVEYFRGIMPTDVMGQPGYVGPRPFLPANAFINVLPNGAGVSAATTANPVKLLQTGSGINVTVAAPTATSAGSSDGLILIRANSDVRQITNDSLTSITTNAGQKSSQLLTPSRIDGINGKDMHLFAIHSCSSADIFYGQYATNTGTTIALDSVSNNPLSALLEKELRINYPAGSTVSNIAPIAYFVGTSSTANTAAINGPTLYQVQLESPAAGGFRRWGTPQPVANWVRAFRVELGVDTDEDGEANVYKRSNNLAANDVVVSARITIEVLSEAQTAVETAPAGTLAAQSTDTTSYPGTRRIVTTRSMVVQLRNGI